MFARRAIYTFTSLVVLGATLAGAAPTHIFARQTGDLQCNIARVKVIGSVLQAAQTTRNLTQELASDPVGSVFVANVTQGLILAEDGIADVVAALFAGQAAPPAARDEVANGLNAAFLAANNITSNDTAITDNVIQLKNQLLAAGDAGDAVLQICK